MPDLIDWSPLRRELAAWRADGLQLKFWWRDDDAVKATPQLDQLADLSRRLGTPVHLAVVPSLAEVSLASAVRDHGFPVLVHGWSHANHSPPGEKAAEFGFPRQTAESEIDQGLKRLRSLFGDTALPVFVPPWNRFSSDLLPALTVGGYRALSMFGPAKPELAWPGIEQVNTHVDPIDWHGARGLCDPGMLIERLVERLHERRAARAEGDVLGLLTHHLVQDQKTWRFCAALLGEIMLGPVRLFVFFDELGSN